MKNFYSLPLRTGDSRKVIKCQICPAAQAAFRISSTAFGGMQNLPSAVKDAGEI